MSVVARLQGTAAKHTVEAVVDSGAEESVAPPGFFAAPVVPSAMSRAGGRYRAANGTRIRNLGQQLVHFSVAEGHKCGMPFQVAEVERPLISVAQLAAAGNTVELGVDGGRIVNRTTGRSIALLRKGVSTSCRCASARPRIFRGKGCKPSVAMPCKT